MPPKVTAPSKKPYVSFFAVDASSKNTVPMMFGIRKLKSMISMTSHAHESPH
eukprot:CAMPEP_0182617160 /NCGR_PEP_ID=MMETSP1330-20130603/41008_1 /TAXON_ID=464278 /ORGANISM="Picochlorum sp., Strain RCC944" /LENGTH=51 /DNA_ID=CAMNT_0024837263 /DNA_START=95 /DNA_END=250 /DNA_ORIENTATION=+